MQKRAELEAGIWLAHRDLLHRKCAIPGEGCRTGTQVLSAGVETDLAVVDLHA